MDTAVEISSKFHRNFIEIPSQNFPPPPPPGPRPEAQILTLLAHFDEILTSRGIFPSTFSKIAQILTLRTHVHHMLPKCPPNAKCVAQVPTPPTQCSPDAESVGQVPTQCKICWRSAHPMQNLLAKCPPDVKLVCPSDHPMQKHSGKMTTRCKISLPK